MTMNTRPIDDLALAMFELVANQQAAALPGGRLLVLDQATRDRYTVDLHDTFQEFRRYAPDSTTAENWLARLEFVVRPGSAQLTPPAAVVAHVAPADDLAHPNAVAEITVVGTDGLGEVDALALEAAFHMLRGGLPLSLEPHSSGSGFLLLADGGVLSKADTARLTNPAGIRIDLSEAGQPLALCQ